MQLAGAVVVGGAASSSSDAGGHNELVAAAAGSLNDLPQEVVAMDMTERLMPGWRKLVHKTHKPMLSGDAGNYLFCKTCGRFASQPRHLKGPKSGLAAECIEAEAVQGVEREDGLKLGDGEGEHEVRERKPRDAGQPQRLER